MKKKLLALLLVFGLAMSLIACGTTEGTADTSDDVGSDEVIELRLATSVQEDHPMNMAAKEFARLVNEESDGHLHITVYCARQLGQDSEVAEMVMQGSLDFVEISASIFANYTPLTTAYQLPFLFTDIEQYRDTIKSQAQQDIMDAITDLGIGIKALAIYNTGFRHIITSKDAPVQTLDDFKNLKIRVGETDLFLDMFKALGAAPTPMAYGEVYSGLQNKIVDASEADYSAIYAEKFYEVTKSMTESFHFMWPGLLAINQGVYDSLSPEDQAIIDKCAVAVYDYNCDNIIECEKYYKDLLISEGYEVNTFAPEVLAQIQELEKPVLEKYAAVDPLIQAFVDEAWKNAR